MLKEDKGNQLLAGSEEVLSSKGNQLLAGSEEVLSSNNMLASYLDLSSILVFSKTCKSARHITYAARKRRALESLLPAIVEGNEALAKKILTSLPELIQDKSATVTNLSGKEIKDQTPLEIAIREGDADMVKMIANVLQEKLKLGRTLGFDPETVMKSQFTEIYRIYVDVKVKTQKDTANEFRFSTLKALLAVINAATAQQVEFDLNHPGLNTDSDLNAALHDFRKQFANLSKQEQIFNPFYLLEAFKFYDDEFNNFSGDADSNDQWNRRDLYWRQVIGYIQCHLPAWLLQAFAQGIPYIGDNIRFDVFSQSFSFIYKDDIKLKRSFKFKYDDLEMRPIIVGDQQKLGYKWAGWLNTERDLEQGLGYIANTGRPVHGRQCKGTGYHAGRTFLALLDAKRPVLRITCGQEGFPRVVSFR